MNTHQIDTLLGGTPCICGDLTGWHPACYVGKTEQEIDDAYRRVYAKARRYLKKMASNKALDSINAARGK